MNRSKRAWGDWKWQNDVEELFGLKKLKAKDDDTAEGFHRLGVKDVGIIETRFEPKHWQAVEPRKENLDQDRTGHLRSLRNAAAGVIAENYRQITVQMLQSCSWNGIWQCVWEEILDRGLDSYLIFKTFASVFYKERSFICHLPRGIDTVDALKDRSSYLDKRICGSGKRHRIEYMTNSLMISSVINELSQLPFNHVVFLDLSNNELSNESWVSLMSLQHLVGLDVSYCQGITDQVLNNWILCMKSGQWQRLQLLCLGNLTGRLSFNILKKLYNVNCLCYLELDPISPKVPDFWISGKTLSQVRSSFVQKYGLAKKYSFLRQAKSILSHPANSRPHLKMDITFGSSYKGSPSWKEKQRPGSDVQAYFRISTPEETETTPRPVFKRNLRPLPENLSALIHSK